MRIVIFDTFASTASIGKITHLLYSKLKEDGHDVLVLHGYKDGVSIDDICLTNIVERKIHYVASKLTGLHGYYSNIATLKAIKILQDFEPDLVQLFNLHGWYLNINRLLKYLSDKKIITVYSMLDEYAYLGRCCYSFECDEYQNGCHKCDIDKSIYPATFFWRRSAKIYNDKANAYKEFNNLCFVGPEWVIGRAKKSLMMKDKEFYCVDEFVDTESIFFPRKKYKFLDESLVKDRRRIVLTVAPYSNPRKGGHFFLELAQSMVGDDSFLFIYVGFDVKGIDVPSNCKTVGFVSNQNELAEYYSIADVFVCTSMADTMPNTCLDALSCGTKVIGFDITGVPYTAEKPYGVFVKPRDVNGLKEAILCINKKEEKDIIDCREYALSRYSPELYYKKMKEIYDDRLKVL